MRNRYLSGPLIFGAALAVCGCSAKRPVEMVDRTPQTLELAESHLLEGRAAEAARLFATISGDDRDTTIDTREALAWVAAGDAGNALRVLDEAGTPAPSDAHVLRALIAWREENANTAYAQIDEALAQDEENAAAWALKGEFDRTLGQNAAAARAFERADVLLFDDDSLKPPVLYNLASAQFFVGAFEDAYETFARFRELKDTDDPNDVLVSGMIAYAMRDHARAVGHLRGLDGESRKAIGALLADESELYQSLFP